MVAIGTDVRNIGACLRRTGIFWAEKFEKNRARDSETTRLLEESGWKVLRIWEHVPAEEAARLVIETVADARREADAAS